MGISVRKLIFLFSLLLIFVSCVEKNKIPRDVLPKEKMEEVMWDMLSAGEFVNGYVLNRADSADKFTANAQQYGRVLQFHKISVEQFDKSYLFYRRNPVFMKEILDSLSKRQISSDLFAPKPEPEKQSDTIKIIDAGDTSLKKPVDSARRDSIMRKLKKLKPVP